jgi:hypothetical protein
MATHTLLVIGSDDPRFGEISLVKGPAVAGKASGRFRTRRAAVVTSLADGALVLVKIGSKLPAPFTPVHSFHKAQHNSPVRKFDLFILVHKGFDLNIFRDLVHCIGPFCGLSRLKETLCSLFFGNLSQEGSGGLTQGFHVTLQTDFLL